MKRIALTRESLIVISIVFVLIFFTFTRLKSYLWKKEGFTTASDPTMKRITNINHKTYGDIYVFDTDDSISNHVLAGEIWEGDLCKEIAERYVPGTDILDIGANLGLNSIRAHQLNPVTGVIHLFEPQPEVFSMMAYNTRDLPRKLYAFPLSNTNEILQFEPKMNNYGGTSMTRSDKGVNVNATSLDSLDFPNKVSIVKMDVEGNEESVLEGGKRFFAKHRPILFIEMWPGKKDAIVSKLQSMDYTMDKHFGGDDYIFVPA